MRYHARDVALRARAARRRGVRARLGDAVARDATSRARAGALGLLVAARARRRARPLPRGRDRRSAHSTCPTATAILSAPLARGDRARRSPPASRRSCSSTGAASRRSSLCRRAATRSRCPHCSVALTYHRARRPAALPLLRLLERVPPKRARRAASRPIEHRASAPSRSSSARDGASRRRASRGSIATPPAATGSSACSTRVARARGRHPRRHADGHQGARLPGRDAASACVLADTGLNLPDFRAARAHLPAARAGRRARRPRRRAGRVLVQTYQPDAPTPSTCARGARLRALRRAELREPRELALSAAHAAWPASASTAPIR